MRILINEGKDIIDFVWRHIICRFGAPKGIESDNGPLFLEAKVTKFFEDWQIKRINSTPYHHKANGQDEFSNKVILHNLNKTLEAANRRWPK